MRILVTGAAGYIGSCLVEKLARDTDVEIYALDNNFRYGYDSLQKVKGGNVHLISGDICKKEDIENLMRENIDFIVHLAALPGERLCKKYPDETIRTNIHGTYLLLEEALNTGIDLFVFASSQVVYGRPRFIPITEEHPIQPYDLYSFTKSAGEALVEIYADKGLPCAILRLSQVYGHGVFARWKDVACKFAKFAIDEKFIPVYKLPNLSEAGQQIGEMLHVKDAADAFIEIIRHKSDVKGAKYNVSYGTGTSIAELARITAGIAGKRFGKQMELKQISVNEEEIPKIIVSNRKIINETGWQPKIGLESGMEDLINKYLYYKEKYGDVREPSNIETPVREVPI